jgi:Domain of unknown function (DUF1707)
MTEPPHVRVSDGERERVAAELREHFAQGRLDTDELEERLARAYGARTVQELEALRTDLPPLPATHPPRRTELAERRSALARELIQQTGASLVPFLVCTAIWLGTGTNGSFWPAWILVVTVIPLLRQGWRLYGPAPDLDHVERELTKDRRGAQQHEAHGDVVSRPRAPGGLPPPGGVRPPPPP